MKNCGKASHQVNFQSNLCTLGTLQSRTKSPRISACWIRKDAPTGSRLSRHNRMGCTIRVASKKGGFLRFYVDNRRFNAITYRDLYPIPRIYESIDLFGESTVSSTVDTRSRDFQGKIGNKNQIQTNFKSRHVLYRFTGMWIGPKTHQTQFSEPWMLYCHQLNGNQCGLPRRHCNILYIARGTYFPRETSTHVTSNRRSDLNPQ